MKKIILLLVFVLCSGCASISDLKKIKSNRSFELKENYIRISNGGMGNNIWVLGLKAGVYKETAEDNNGTYFIGEGEPVIVLAQKAAENYLTRIGVDVKQYYKDGRGGSKIGRMWLPVTEATDVKSGKFEDGATSGGLFIPKKGVDQVVKLIYTMKLTQQARDYSPVLGGMLDGAIGGNDFATESELLNNIVITSK